MDVEGVGLGDEDLRASVGGLSVERGGAGRFEEEGEDLTLKRVDRESLRKPRLARSTLRRTEQRLTVWEGSTLAMILSLDPVSTPNWISNPQHVQPNLLAVSFH